MRLVCGLSHRIILLQLREIALLLELSDDAELKIVFDLAAPVLGRAVAVAPTSVLARNNLAWARAMLTRSNATAAVMP